MKRSRRRTRRSDDFSSTKCTQAPEEGVDLCTLHTFHFALLLFSAASCFQQPPSILTGTLSCALRSMRGSGTRQKWSRHHMKEKMKQETIPFWVRFANTQRPWRGLASGPEHEDAQKMRNIFGCPNMTRCPPSKCSGNKMQGSTRCDPKNEKHNPKKSWTKEKKSHWSINCKVMKVASASTHKKRSSRKIECTTSSRSLKNRKKHSTRRMAKITRKRNGTDSKTRLSTDQRCSRSTKNTWQKRRSALRSARKPHVKQEREGIVSRKDSECRKANWWTAGCSDDYPAHDV